VTRRAIRIITIAAMAIVLVACAAGFVASLSGDTELAVVRDTRLEPDVPMGALVVFFDASEHFVQPGDVVQKPAPSQTEFQRFTFGTDTVARADCVFECERTPMQFFVPLVGYVMWFGPFGPPVFFTVAFTVLYLTLRHSDNVHGAKDRVQQGEAA
jgi:hypothetical protein